MMEVVQKSARLAASVIACLACVVATAAEGDNDKAENRPAKIPPVFLTKAHEALCKVKVGDTMPDVSAPQVAGGDVAKLSSHYGKKATVVVFWSPDRRMCRELLADLGPDVATPFGKAGVTVVGVAVAPAAESQAALKAAEAEFPNLVDEDGKAFAQVGSQKLPRTYLLDPQGKILWFDIEYSHGTRRELREALRAVAGEPSSNE